MYYAFFRLNENPFSMAPNPDYILWTPQHLEAAAVLTYGITSGKGLMVATGGPGTGKTTILSKVLQSLPAEKVSAAVVFNPTLTPGELLETVLLDFGIKDVPQSKALRIRLLRNLLLDNRASGRVSLLAIDEAHKLSHELLEEVRLLGNFDPSIGSPLQIILLGQPELDELLNLNSLAQLKQRIALRFTLGPIESEAVERYIQFRWQIAGGELPAPFTAEATSAVAKYSGCVPRLINSICDNALLSAFAERTKVVSDGHVQEACKDLHVMLTERLADSHAAGLAPVANTPAPAAVTVPEITPLPDTLRSDLSLRTLTEIAARAEERMFLLRWIDAIRPRRTQMEKI